MAFIGPKKPSAIVSCDLCGVHFTIYLSAARMAVHPDWERVSVLFWPHLGENKDELWADGTGEVRLEHVCLVCRTTISTEFDKILATMRTAGGPSEPS